MHWSAVLRPTLPLAAQAWLGWRSSRAWTGLAVVPSAPPPSPLGGHPPSLSVIVPARDEAATLPMLLPSLLAQAYPGLELIVVDDDSTDDTATVAAALGARVVAAGPLPPGWAGKPRACVIGATAARGEWLLFTDADTRHAPDSLIAAIAYAAGHDLESLSLLPAQVCVTPWEKLLLPYAYAHLFAGIDAAAIHDPARDTALLNGQYLLIRRDAYQRAGTHAAVRDSIVEDVAFGRILKQRGIRHQTARGQQLVAVRMYTGLGAIIAGFSKNSVRFAAQEPRRGVAVVLSTLLAAAPLFRLLSLLVRRQRPSGEDLAGILGGYAVAVAALVPWQRRFSTASGWALAQPLTAALFQTISLGGIWSASVRGQTRWKGRRY